MKRSLSLFGVLIFLMISQACEPRGANRESIEDDNSYEMLEGEDIPPAEEDDVDTTGVMDTISSADILQLRQLKDESMKYKKLLDSIAQQNPNITYTYTPTSDGRIKTVLGDYKVQVDGSLTPDEKSSIAVLLQRRFENRQEMLNYYNKLKNVDLPARPVNGYAEFYETLKENMHLPEEVRNSNVEGLLFLQLSIEKDGTISNVEIAENINIDSKSVEEAIEKTAIRAVKKTNIKWHAAQANGKPVRSKQEIPVMLDSNVPS